MPPGPLSEAAEKTVTDTNVPQQPVAAPAVIPGPGPTPTNQTTTKPRQMPGGGSGLMDDPAANGSDVDSSGDPDPSAATDDADSSAPPVQAKRHDAYLLSDLMADITASNPSLGWQGSYHLAKRVLDEYPMAKQADGQHWNPLEFGHRGKVPDGPLTDKVRNGFGRQPVPAESPSRRQPTVQPEHQRLLGPGRSGPPALEGTVVEPLGIGPGPTGVEPKGRTMVMDPDGVNWHWDDEIDHKAGANA